jgi:hypothetical protein
MPCEDDGPLRDLTKDDFAVLDRIGARHAE